jgi:threonine aldolase
MQFASDNWAGAPPQIVEAIVAEAARSAAAYGGSPLDQAVAKRFCEIFERDVAVYFVATGSAANALALATVSRPAGVVFCHADSHIVEDEVGGVEFLAGGARVVAVEGPLAKLDPAALSRTIARFPPGSVRTGQPMAVSITQQTELGTAYGVDEIRAIAEVAKARDLPLHMDGARFANALAQSNASPAEMTWKAGVDILSFGATKNGCIAAEALVFFHPDMARDMPFLRKRSGHLFSKARFVAAQFDAYLRDGLWLDLARHANAMADRLRAGLARSAQAREAWATGGNEVFAVLKRADAARLREAGAAFHDWPQPLGGGSAEVGEDETIVRLVTAFSTQADEVDALLAALG